MTNRGPSASSFIPPKNSWSADITFAADVSNDGIATAIDLGVLPAPGAAVELFKPTTARYGQNIVNTDVATSITVHGYTWLGQPITETIAANTAGVRAFMIVSKVSGAGTLSDLDWGDKYGLPYAAAASTVSGATVVAAHATTGDRRGTITFDTDPDGEDTYSVTYNVDLTKPLYGAAY